MKIYAVIAGHDPEGESVKSLMLFESEFDAQQYANKLIESDYYDHAYCETKYVQPRSSQSSVDLGDNFYDRVADSLSQAAVEFEVVN